MGSYATYSNYSMVLDSNNLGLFRFVFDKSTGEMLTSCYLKWDSLKDKLDINENGLIKKDHLYIHTILPEENGNVIVVTEAFENSSATTKNLCFFEFDDQFVLKDFFIVEKTKSKLSHYGAATWLMKNNDLFDITDYQNLGNDEFLFFFNKMKRIPISTKYGIVSYANGAFKRQTLDLNRKQYYLSV